MPHLSNSAPLLELSSLLHTQPTTELRTEVY